MAVPTVTFHLQSAVHSSVTMNKTAYGPLDAIINENAQNVAHRTADAIYPTAQAITDKDPVIFLKICDPTIAITPGTKASLVMTMKKADGTTKVGTAVNMVYVGLDTTQIRANPSESVLKFVHESADGSTAWLTWA